MTRAVRVVNPWTIGGGGRFRELIPLPVWLVLLGRLVAWLVRHPVVTAELTLAGWLTTRYGPRTGIIVTVVTNAGLLVAIAAVGSLGGMPLQAIVTGVSRRRRLRRRWFSAAAAAGAVLRDGGSRTAAPVRRLRPTAAGLRASVAVGDVGKTADQLAAQRQKLAAVLGCREVYVRQGRHPGIATVDFVWGDPLLRTIRLRDLPSPEPDALTFALSEDGEPVSIQRDTSLLIAGLAGGGKSGTIWALLAAVVMSGVPYRLIVIDPKGGMELRALKDVAARYAIMPEEIAQVLTDTVRDMRARATLLGDRGQRKYVPTTAMPYTIVIVDEFLALTTFAPKNLKGRIERDLGVLITQGRAPGFVGWFATQGTQLDALGRARTFIPQRLCHATDDVETTVAALGSDARHNARCDKISLRTQRGVGYLHVDGQRGFTRWRTAWVPDSETRLIAAGRLPDDAFSARPLTPARRSLRRRRSDRELETDRTALYRWVDADDVVLYIGISNDPDRRIGQHVDGKPWVVEAVRVDIVDWYDSRDEALAAEEELIRGERPRYNVVHNGDNVVAYDGDGGVVDVDDFEVTSTEQVWSDRA